jgi:hypothetical protein
MHNARFRVMAGLAGATLCLFAATAYGQNPTTQTTTGATGTGGASGQTAQPTTPAPTDQTTPAPAATDANGSVTSTATDVSTTTTTTRTFPGGTLGIVAVAVVVLLLLFGLFRGRDKTVVRDTYVANPPVTGSRTVTTSTTTDDRMNLNSRAASGPGTNPGAGMNDPNERR